MANSSIQRSSRCRKENENEPTMRRRAVCRDKEWQVQATRCNAQVYATGMRQMQMRLWNMRCNEERELNIVRRRWMFWTMSVMYRTSKQGPTALKGTIPSNTKQHTNICQRMQGSSLKCNVGKVSCVRCFINMSHTEMSQACRHNKTGRVRRKHLFEREMSNFQQEKVKWEYSAHCTYMRKLQQRQAKYTHT